MHFSAIVQAVAETSAEAASVGVLDYGDAGLIIAAMAAIGTAAYAVVDSSKAFWGGISNVGFGHIQTCLSRFGGTLSAALPGQNWQMVFRAHWRNGIAKEEQKAIVRSLLRLGMRLETVDELAKAGNVDPAALTKVMKRLEAGDELDTKDLNIMGRLDASIAAVIDAAFERADQQFRNVSRLLAGLSAVVLSVVANYTALDEPMPAALAVAVGVLAVPIAPIAKDITSALSTTMRSIKAIKGAGL